MCGHWAARQARPQGAATRCKPMHHSNAMHAAAGSAHLLASCAQREPQGRLAASRAQVAGLRMKRGDPSRCVVGMPSACTVHSAVHTEKMHRCRAPCAMHRTSTRSATVAVLVRRARAESQPSRAAAWNFSRVGSTAERTPSRLLSMERVQSRGSRTLARAHAASPSFTSATACRGVTLGDCRAGEWR